MGRRYDIDIENDRAVGALLGVAIGDALGMPSQTLPRDRIRALYGTIGDFIAATSDHPVSGGLPAGTITDDTEQSLLLARHLLKRRGEFDERVWARELIAWEQETHARGVNDLLGPSTKRAIGALLRGEPPEKVGRFGTTNGAAMRIAPVGVAVGPEPLDALVDAVAATCRLTHNTGEAIGAAAAVAAVVSAGVGGAGFEDALPIALAAASAGERRAPLSGMGSIAERIDRALELARHGAGQEAADRIADQVGVSVAAAESVPMAFAVARLSGGDAWRAGVLSANVGDDTDTIGAIAAGMCGACRGASSLPADKAAKVIAVNRLDLAAVAHGLLELRHVRAAAALEVGQ
jgi:ADP-ribosylglycohydrolase